jgi:hypothetical protein
VKVKQIINLIPILYALIFASCSVREDISITLGGAGSADISVKLKPIFVSYILDLSEAFSDTGTVAKTDIFMIDEIKKQINSKPGAQIIGISSPAQETLEISLKFSDIRTLIESKDAGVRDIITFTDTNGVKKLQFHLEKSNYTSLTGLFPILKNPVFENLAPQVNEDITTSEYLSIIEFAMGKGGPNAVLSSEIDVKVKTGGTIVSQKGGIITGNTVVFQIPLIRVCLLNQPLDFEIVYK